MYGDYWGGMGYGMGWGGHMVGWLFMLLFWVLIIVVTVAAVRWLTGGTAMRDGKSSPQSAVDILRERYARGEIDREEFQQRKRDLEQ